MAIENKQIAYETLNLPIFNNMIYWFCQLTMNFRGYLSFVGVHPSNARYMDNFS